LRRSIERWEENLIDTAVVVRDRRAEVDAHVQRLRAAERELEAVARHLAQLVVLAQDPNALAAMFGREAR
jgi:hypothetical protein